MRDTQYASHFGGGGYNRGGRYYSSQICRACIEDLLSYESEGHNMVSQWDVRSLKRALQRFQAEDEAKEADANL